MDEGKILLANLRKGEVAEANARFLGMVLMAKIFQATMQRTTIPPQKRRVFYLHVDEFQSLATGNLALLLSEARKFGLALVLAKQFTLHIEDKRVVESLFGNVGTVISFCVGREDAEILQGHFLPTFNELDLVNLPNWTACVKATVRGEPVVPFSLQTILPESAPDPAVAAEVRRRSRRKYEREGR